MGKSVSSPFLFFFCQNDAAFLLLLPSPLFPFSLSKLLLWKGEGGRGAGRRRRGHCQKWLSRSQQSKSGRRSLLSLPLSLSHTHSYSECEERGGRKIEEGSEFTLLHRSPSVHTLSVRTRKHTHTGRGLFDIWFRCVIFHRGY